MDFESKNISLLLLGITALGLSRIAFLFVNDPEGPNLVVVIGMALILFLPSAALYVFNLPISGVKKPLLALLIQILLVVGFYFFLS